ncbi:GxxExxY protein [Pedobacter sp. AJM]
MSYDIIGYAIRVHKYLGPGLLESVYEQCLSYELEKNGHQVIKQAMVLFE